MMSLTIWHLLFETSLTRTLMNARWTNLITPNHFLFFYSREYRLTFGSSSLTEYSSPNSTNSSPENLPNKDTQVVKFALPLQEPKLLFVRLILKKSLEIKVVVFVNLRLLFKRDLNSVRELWNCMPKRFNREV